MTDQGLSPIHRSARSNWIRLRTLVLLRWFAIAGQVIALNLAQLVYGLRLELGLCYLAIGAAVTANLIAMFIYPENRRLTEAETLLMLLFDTLQLSALLYLAGGLSNPFALLILVPVTIASLALTARSTLILGGVTIALASLVALVHMPFIGEDGLIIELPQMFVFGAWVAIVIGVVFLAIYARRVTSEIQLMSDALIATRMALEREQKLADLTSVVAAAAHELGTPLATIKLVSSELIDELDDKSDLYDDAVLLRDQADRCRDILRSMGRIGKEDNHLNYARISAVLDEAAQPHCERGKHVHFLTADRDGPEPVISRQPAIVHGLRNLIQNAVDFSTAEVWVEADWSDTDLSIRIIDDGPGFSSHLIGRIGEPFLGRKRPEVQVDSRPEYDGMGLGLFIAITLLERARAELSFANGSKRLRTHLKTRAKLGAVVEIRWKLADLVAPGTPDVRG